MKCLRRAENTTPIHCSIATYMQLVLLQLTHVYVIVEKSAEAKSKLAAEISKSYSFHPIGHHVAFAS